MSQQEQVKREPAKSPAGKKPAVSSVEPVGQEFPNPLNPLAALSPDAMFQPVRQMLDWMDAAFTSWPYRWDTMPRSVFGDLNALETRADIAETDDSVEISLEVPGISADDIDISVCGPLLTVHGEKKTESDRQDKNLRHVERHYGAFRRSFRIPDGIDSKQIEANFDNGVLTLHMPKDGKSSHPVKKVEVKS